MGLKEFKDVLRKLATELEDIWIEKETYRELVVLSGVSTSQVLQDSVEKALADPENRKRVRERFSAMWEALDEVGSSAWIEDLLKRHSPSGKPN